MIEFEDGIEDWAYFGNRLHSRSEYEAFVEQ